MSDNLEKMKNEIIFSRMNKKRNEMRIYIPLTVFISGFLTYMIIISWNMFVLK